MFRRNGLKPPAVMVTSGLIGMLSISADTECLFCGPERVIRHRITAGSLTSIAVEGFEMTPVAVSFLSLVDPTPGSAMADWLAALEAESGRLGGGFA